MPDDLQAIVQRMVAAGEPEDQIALVIQHYKPAAPAAAAPAAPSMADLAAQGPSAARGAAGPEGVGMRYIGDHPVQAGAMAGGMLATGGASLPAQMALAALGAAGGAGYGMLAKGARTGDVGTPGGNARDMALNAAAAATGEGIGGGVIQPAVQGLGKLVYKAALRPANALQREFGDLASDGLKAGLPVSDAGLRQAEQGLGQSGQAARDLIAGAAPTAAPVRVVTEVGKETTPIIQRATLRAKTGLPDESGGIVQRIRSMQQANPGGIDLQTAQDMKGELQDLAARVYRAQDKGAPVTDLGADTNAAMARGLRQGLEARVPGLADVNAQSQTLIGLKHAIENATMRNVPGVGSLRTLLGDFMPAVSSTAAIGATKAAPAAPSALRLLLAALAGGDQ